MGETAEVLAREHGISRDAQDAFALESHRRAAAAAARLTEEICPIYVNGHRPAAAILQDNGPRANQSTEALAKLKPVFDRRTGTVTAGNASQITDGAVALLVMTEQRAVELGFEPLGVLSGYAYAGCEPSRTLTPAAPARGNTPASAAARRADRFSVPNRATSAPA